MPEIGINSWLYCSFPTWTPSYSLETAIERIDGLGYDSIEIGAASPHAWPPYMEGERLDAVQQALADSDLTVSSICPALGGGPGPNPASPIKQEREAAYQHYTGCLKVADALDSEIVIWVGGWHLAEQSPADAWENMTDTLERVVEDAERLDKTIAIEATPADSNLIDTPHDQLEAIETVGSDNVGAMFDTFHALEQGDSPTEYVKLLGDELVHLHLADSNRLPPGDGELSFQPALDQLESIGYNGAYTVEIFGDHLNPDEAALASLENVRAFFE